MNCSCISCSCLNCSCIKCSRINCSRINCSHINCSHINCSHINCSCKKSFRTLPNYFPFVGRRPCISSHQMKPTDIKIQVLTDNLSFFNRFTALQDTRKCGANCSSSFWRPPVWRNPSAPNRLIVPKSPSPKSSANGWKPENRKYFSGFSARNRSCYRHHQLLWSDRLDILPKFVKNCAKKTTGEPSATVPTVCHPQSGPLPLLLQKIRNRKLKKFENRKIFWKQTFLCLRSDFE